MFRSLNSYLRLYLGFFFVYKSFSEVIFKVFNFTSVVQRYVSQHEDESATTNTAAEEDVKIFSAEFESVVSLNPSLGTTEKELFKEFHDFAIESAKNHEIKQIRDCVTDVTKVEIAILKYFGPINSIKIKRSYCYT